VQHNINSIHTACVRGGHGGVERGQQQRNHCRIITVDASVTKWALCTVGHACMRKAHPHKSNCGVGASRPTPTQQSTTQCDIATSVGEGCACKGRHARGAGEATISEITTRGVDGG